MVKYLAILAVNILLIGCIRKEQKTPNTIQIPVRAISEVPVRNENLMYMDLVFCLDATGSMSGLIGTAKEKIWDIVSELAQKENIDSLRLGMIFYRDRGDLFVTKQIAMTSDLDMVYSELLKIQADGGGDSPESVNQALYESIDQMNWNKDENALKTIFLVGDCPPHMDYLDDTSYEISCKNARSQNILINTIKLGPECLDATHHFKKIAHCGNGNYLHLDQNATDQIYSTPYDDEINEISRNIDESRIYYGTEKEQSEKNDIKEKSLEIYDKASSSANSSRANYKLSKLGKKSWFGDKEIIEEYKKDKEIIQKLKEEELPGELKNKSIEEMETFLNDKIQERNLNETKLKELNIKRKEFIEKEIKRKNPEDSLSFSQEVIDLLEKQYESSK